MRYVKTEVLVVGGGLAGLCAALEAAEAGKDVTLVCKMKPGRSGNTIVAGCIMSVCLPQRGDSTSRFIEDIVSSGCGLSSPPLARVLAERSAQVVPFLERHGVRFLYQKSELMVKHAPGHSCPRAVSTIPKGHSAAMGLTFSLPLLQAAATAGVHLVGSTMVVSLQRGHGGGHSAIAVDSDGNWTQFACDAIILACGGGGRLFEHSNNTREMTGDGLALSFLAGAELRDLEFVQFHPTIGIEPIKITIPTTLFADGAVLRNSFGQRFLLRNHPGGEVTVTRDLMSRAIFTEVKEGRGISGGVHLDLSQVSQATVAANYQNLWNLLLQKGCDPGREPITVGLAVHFFMGGMTIDQKAASTVPGLFGAGEVTGGLHGANRLGGNALLEAVVFGRIAGRSAANFKKAGQTPIPQSMPGRIPVISANGELDEIFTRLRRLLWEKSGVVRSAQTLAQGLSELDELCQSFSCITKTPSLFRYFELRNMLISARLIFMAAMERKESRGSHYRVDYPKKNDAGWLGSVFLKRRGFDIEQFRADFDQFGLSLSDIKYHIKFNAESNHIAC